MNNFHFFQKLQEQNIFHFGPWSDNFGNNFIRQSIRNTLDYLSPYPLVFHYYNSQQTIFTEEFINFLNQKADLLLFGCEDMFLSSSQDNSIIGLQWNIAPDLIDQIQVPLIFQGIGIKYSPFVCNPTSIPLISNSNIQKLVRNASLFSVQNNAIKQELIKHGCASEKIQVIPNSGMFLRPSKIEIPGFDKGKFHVGFYWPTDNQEFSFSETLGKNRDYFIDNLINLFGDLITKYNAQIFYIGHMGFDDDFLCTLKEKMSAPPIIIDQYLLEHCSTCVDNARNIVDVFRQMDLVFSMAEYSNIVSFGQNTPFISFGNQRNQRNFLEEIKRSKYFIELRSQSACSYFSMSQMMERLLQEYDHEKLICGVELEKQKIKYLGFNQRIIDILIEKINSKQQEGSNLLAKRYQNDGKPYIVLNDLQIEKKQTIEKKIKQGIYSFLPVRPCPIGLGEDFDQIAEKDRYGLQTSIVICKSCGLIQTNPYLTEESCSTFYKDEYRDLYFGVSTPSVDFFQFQYKRGALIYKFLQNNGLITPNQSYNILEIGCGSGGILQYFKEQGCSILGLDFDEKYLEFGRTHYGLDLRTGDISNLPNNFVPDLVIYAHVLEHITDVNDELQRIKRILVNPDALLYIEVPNNKNFYGNFRTDLLLELQNAHVYYFTKRTLNNLLEKNGYQLISGNEQIQSVFKVRKGNDALSFFINDYHDSISYLKVAEIAFENDLEQKRIASQLEKSDRFLQELDLEIANYRQNLSNISQEILLLQNIITNKDSVIDTLNQNIRKIEGSKYWKLSLIIQKIVKKIAPINSTRRKILILIVNIINKLFKKINNNQRYKKDMELILSSDLFDKQWYLSMYPDVANAKINPIIHYLEHGWAEGRDPGKKFNTKFYLQTYEDVRLSGICPLIHYLSYGRKEGRVIISPTNPTGEK